MNTINHKSETDNVGLGAISPLAQAFWQNGRSEECPIYDLHGHMDTYARIYFPRAELNRMLDTMDECGVRLLVFSHHHTLFAPDIGNQVAVDAARLHPSRLRAYCVVNPNYPELIKKDLAAFEQNRDVYVGFKFHPDYHEAAITDQGYRPALEYANQHGLLLLSHTWGGSVYSDTTIARQIAEEYPNIRFLLGHSCHGEWDAVVELVREHPNTYLEGTAIFDDCGILEKFTAEAGSDRILFGTDLPWFDPHQAIGALLSAHISDEDRHNICHRNAEKLLAPFLPA